MRTRTNQILSVLAMLGLVMGLVAVFTADTVVADNPTAGKTEPLGCCDPALQPGANGNPYCFEGARCCSDGVWRCNNPNGTPSCAPGEVCQDCGGTGASCSADGDCCSNKCKHGVCR